MAKVLKVMGIVLLILVSLIVAGAGFLYYVIAHAPMVPKGYWNEVETGGAIEAHYLALGPCEVDHLEVDAEEPVNKHVIYYPKGLEEEKYPVVLVANGTGVFANKAKALFQHLASWGFIVIGDHDGSTWSGRSAELDLDFLLGLNEDPDSIFFQKVDTENIGITGHSQGGVGVFNAIQNTGHSSLYKCAVSLSPTEEELAALLQMPYDASKTTIPILLLAGTENDVISVDKLVEMYGRIPSDKAMAVRTGAQHGQMLYAADGYVTAWFMWQLKADTYAASAFTRADPELAANGLYQDQYVDLAG